jgi:prolyl oligopeptidase
LSPSAALGYAARMRLQIFAVLLLVGCASTPSVVVEAPRRPATSLEVVPPPPKVEAPVEDPYLWLEEVSGKKPLEWAETQNKKALAELDSPAREALRKRLLAIYDSKEKIPSVDAKGKWLYNFWRDDQHERGLWRRVSVDGYKKKDPAWETVIDVDALAAAEKENWVFKDSTCLKPKEELCLIALSRGGGDAVVTREFDTVKKQFVTAGFSLPEAKPSVMWKDENTLFVATDFGPGSLTTSGYPRIVKEWKRGTPLEQATLISEGKDTDVDVFAYRDWHQGKTIDLVQRDVTFFSTEEFILENGKLEKIDKPEDAKTGFFGEYLLLELRSDWKVGEKTFPAGALLAAKLKDFRAGKRELEVLFEPAKNKSLLAWTRTKSHLVLNELEDVRNKLWVLSPEKSKWKRAALPLPETGSFQVDAFSSNGSDQYWLHAADFTQPTRLELGDLKTNKREALKAMPAFFDAAGLETKQYFATSKDGTKVPYFVVARKDLKLDGNTPVLMTGYGGFEVSLTPYYSGALGAAWLDKGAFVLANIRGGGEYGPQWHESAIKQNRQRVYDDFIAVAEDLIAKKITSTKRLGIMGASNGGLLMGVMLTQRPDLFGAIVCSVPLLDMKRYHTLLAGASWMGEYGDPRIEDEWAALAKFSPYQNVKKGAKYPRILFTTSTLDDRVHPGHARKMVARMLEQGHDVQYFENTEGGHGGAANNAQKANLLSLEYVFLANQLTK